MPGALRCITYASRRHLAVKEAGFDTRAEDSWPKSLYQAGGPNLIHHITYNICVRRSIVSADAAR